MWMLNEPLYTSHKSIIGIVSAIGIIMVLRHKYGLL